MRIYALINTVSALQYCLWAKGMRECDPEETLPQLPCVEKKIPNQKQGLVFYCKFQHFLPSKNLGKAVLKWLKYSTTVKANDKSEPCCRYNDFWALMSGFAGVEQESVWN